MMCIRPLASCLAALLPLLFLAPALAQGPQPGPNVNMVSGKSWPGGDPNLQRQNEPSVAVSTRNPMHLLGGANDYRTVDLAGLLMQEEDSVTPDAWLGVFKSFDGGMTWQSTLLPGCPYNPLSGENPCVGSPVSPLRGKGYTAGADPTVRAGAHGMFYYSFIAFDRNNKKNGALAVASFIDNNNKEAGDTIRYLGTSVVDDNAGGQFTDKPYIAVDRPRTGGGSCIIGGPGTPAQTLTAGNIYLAYTIFLGNDQNIRSKLILAASTDCAKTWRLLKLSEGVHVNQGATIAIDPDSGAVYVAWRRFKTSSQTDSMVVVKSTDGGQTFTKPVDIVPSILPFDQKTSESAVAFRTNSYPTMAAINGRVYVAWADRMTGPAAEARILLFSSADGLTWASHGSVDPPMIGYTTMGPRGHQIMPALTAAGGKLTLVYYDLREDHTSATYDYSGEQLYEKDRKWVPGDAGASVFKEGITDQALLRRHTIDVRVVQIPVTLAGPGSPSSVRVSQYAFGSTPSKPSEIRQLGFNPPNLRIFRKGTVPFFGDYIDVAALPYVPDGSGWIANTAPSNSTVFHAAWTDNRNVYPGDVNKYAPPGSQGGASLFEPALTKPPCVPGTSKTGVLNQDVYTARITEGLAVGSLGNAKPLNMTFQRAFSFFVQNTRKRDCTSYRLTIVPTDGVATSFKDLGQAPVTVLNVTIGPKSSIARTVFAKALVATAAKRSLKVLVQELDASGCAPSNLGSASVKPGGLQGSVVMNPEIENPEIENPEIENPIPIATSEVYNPEIENPEIENPEIENPEIENPEIENPEIENVEVANPEIENPEIENPEIENPEIENPEIENIPLSGRVTDVSWKVTNRGNTSASYNAKLLAGRTAPNGIKLQLLVHKLYRSPVADPANSCQLKVQTQNVVMVNIPNPVFTSAGSLENPEIENSAVTNGTFSLAPGETAKITLRYLDPDKITSPNLCGVAPLPPCGPGDFNPVNEVQPVPAPQAPATTGGYSLPLTITTFSLPNATLGSPYNQTLQAVGGSGARTWTQTAGALPTGVALSSAGVLSGTPTVSGSFSFTVRVTDSATPTPHQAARTFTLVVGIPPAVGLVFSTGPANVRNGQVIAPAVQVLAMIGFNPVPGVSITMSVANNPSSGFLIGSLTAVTNGAGFATFSDLSIIGAGAGYTLRASSGAATNVSSPFTVSGLVQTANMPQGRYGHSATLLPTGKVVIFGGQDANTGAVIHGEVAFDPVTKTFSTFGGGSGGATAYHTAVVIPQGFVLLSGGFNSSFTAQSSQQFLSIGNGTIGIAGSMLTARYKHTATVLPDGRVYLAGGLGTTGTPLAQAEMFAPQLASSTPANMPGPRAQHTATLLPNGLVLVAGGNGPGALNTAVLFDSLTNTYTSTLNNMTSARYAHTATLLPTGEVLIAGGTDAGGIDLNTAELYDPVTNRFTATGTMASRRSNGTATRLASGMVLLTGGTGGGGNNDSVEIYDRTTGTFTAFSDLMLIPRTDHTATPMADGSVLIAGSKVAASFSNLTEIFYAFDPAFAPAAVVSTGSMAGPRTEAAVTRLGNGKVLLTGGRYTLSPVLPPSTPVLFTAEVYDPATGTFTSTANSIGAPRVSHTATLLENGKVLVAGGYTGFMGPSVEMTALLYDPLANSFGPMMLMNRARYGHTATLLHTGQVLIAGGINAAGVYEATAELYDPVSNSFTLLAGPMNTPRAFHAATRLGAGYVMLVGGRNGTTTLSSTEIFDYNTNTFSTTAPAMFTPREGHTATLLPTGDLLVTGGRNSGGGLTSTEVYTFATATFLPGPTMNAMRYDHFAVLLPTGRVLITGGPYSSVQIYDPWTGTLSPTVGIDQTRMSGAFVLLCNGKVLMAGGGITDPPFSTAALYLPPVF